MEKTSQFEERKRNFKPLHHDDEARIREALEICGGDRLEAAKILKIGKTSIYRKLAKLGIARTTRRPDYDAIKQEFLNSLDQGAKHQ